MMEKHGRNGFLESSVTCLEALEKHLQNFLEALLFFNFENLHVKKFLETAACLDQDTSCVIMLLDEHFAD